MMRARLFRIFTAFSILVTTLIPNISVSAADKIFTDNFSDLTKCVETDGLKNYSLFCDAEASVPGFKFNNKQNKDAVNAAIPSSTGEGYVIYQVSGDISSFSIDCIDSTYANNGIWKVSLSQDMESWTEYEAYCSVSEKNQSDDIPDLPVSAVINKKLEMYYRENDTLTSYSKWCNTLKIGAPSKIETGTRFLKIETPIYTGKWGADMFGRAITGVSITYTTGFSAQINGGESVEAGKNSFRIDYSMPINGEEFPRVIHNGSDCTVISCETAQDRCSSVVTLENVLEEGEYEVILSSSLVNDVGDGCNNPNLKFTAEYPGVKARICNDGVISLSEQRVEVIFSGAMNDFTADDVTLTKDGEVIGGYILTQSQDKKTASLSFTNLTEGTYILNFSDNVTDVKFGVPIPDKYRNLEFTAIADRTAMFESDTADSENQQFKIIFSHAMEEIKKSQLDVKNSKSESIGIKSVEMSADGLFCTIKFDNAAAAKYTLAFADDVYDRKGYRLNSSSKALSFEIIDYGTSAKLKESVVKAENNSVTVIFGDKIAVISPEMVTLKNSFNNIVKVSETNLSQDRLSCEIIIDSLGADSYTLELGSDIRTEQNHTIKTTDKLLAFTSLDERPGRRTFEDDFGYKKGAPDISKVNSASNEMQIRTTSGFTKDTIATSTQYKEKEKIIALSAGPALKNPYVIYKTDGIISDFDVSVMYWGVKEKLHDGEYKFYLSDDGETWISPDPETEYSQTTPERTDYDSNWWKKSYKNSVSLSKYNAVYIKICYPEKTEGTSDNSGWGARNICNVRLSYNYGSGGARVTQCGTENNGKIFYADVLFTNPLDEETVKTEYFTLENNDAACSSVKYSKESGVLRIYFDKQLEFNKPYTLLVSSSMTDKYGFAVNENSLRQPLTFSEPEKIIINTENPFNTDKISAGKEISCSADVTANYAKNSETQRITMVMVMLRDEKICKITSDSRIAEVGKNILFNAALTVPTDVTAREEVKVKVYFIDSYSGLELLTDRVYTLN